MIPLLLMAALAAGAQAPAADPNAPSPSRPPLGFKVFKNIERPVTGMWDLEIPGAASRRIEIKELVAGNPGMLVGVDPATKADLLRLERRVEGIGYQGQLLEVFAECGLETLSISEFLPLGDAVVMRFDTAMTESACAPFDGGKAGKLRIFSGRGGTVRLRDLSEISGPDVRETYGIGGERQTTATTSYSLTGVSMESGSEVRFLQRLRAPLDRSLWFEVEAVMTPEAGVAPPRGFVRGDSLRIAGSLTLRRAE